MRVAAGLLPCRFRDDQCSGMVVALRVYFAEACPAMKLAEIRRAVDEGLMYFGKIRNIRLSLLPWILLISFDLQPQVTVLV